ncbi:hypothetical protein ABMA28_004959 [Loxostege sticticalis]|uniref:Reverse transcriptase domain-containing protein n=1 Tax=Loxostege sticticalis TaxID=481309 RepID=A0ABD0SNS8_LOXSC
MGFGLRNAAQTFQRFVDEVLHGLESFAYGYVDDILVFSPSISRHKDDLRKVLDRLKQYGVLINTTKCRWGQKEVTFLGYQVSSAGVQPIPDKVRAIQEYPVPKTVKELRRFLGMLNFNRRFIPMAAQLQAPLNSLLAGPKIKGSHPITMTADLLQAFENLLAAQQDNDAELQKLLQHGSTLKLQKVSIPDSDVKVYCDVSTHTSRPYVTPALRRQVFDMVHNLSHPGRTATYLLLPTITHKNHDWCRDITPSAHFPTLVPVTSVRAPDRFGCLRAE